MTEAEQAELDALNAELEQEKLRALQAGDVETFKMLAGPAQAPRFDEFDSAARGALQGASARLSDEAWGAGGGLYMLGHQLGRSEHPVDDALNVYRLMRDDQRQANAQAHEENPKFYGGGEIAGGVALGGPSVSSLKGAMAAGAGLGALSGLGGSDADLTTASTDNVARSGVDTLIGAGEGALAGLVGHGIAKAAPVLLRAGRTGLEKMGIAQGRRALLNGADSLSNKMQVSDDAVRAALEGNLNPFSSKAGPAIKPFGTTQGASMRLDALREDYGKVYGALLSDLEAQGVKGPVAQEVAKRLLARSGQEFATTGSNKAVADAFGDEAANILKMAEINGSGRTLSAAELAHGGAAPGSKRLGLTQAEAIKRDLQAAASSEYRKMGGSKPLGEAKKEIASIVRAANEEAVDAAGQAAPEFSDVRNLADGFVPVKRKMGNLIEAADAAERGATRSANRSAIGLPEKIAMAGGIATGNPGQALTAVASGGLTRALFNRGASTAASTAYAGSRLLKALANAAASRPALVAGGTNRLAGATERAIAPGPALPLVGEDDRARVQALLEALRGM